MRTIGIMVRVVAFSLLFACSSNTDTREIVENQESILLALLIERSDVTTYDCNWVYDFLDQTISVDINQADESATRTLVGTCFIPGNDPAHITLKHELYLFVSSKPDELDSFLTPLSDDVDWRNFDFGNGFHEPNVVTCAVYKKVDLQDCFVVSQYDQIISVVRINIEQDMLDAHLKTIILDGLVAVERRMAEFEDK